MIDMLAAGLASVLSLVVFGLLAAWYAVPWLRTQERAISLIALLWVHAFRHVALQIFSAQRFGFAVSDAARDEIAAGDVVGMVLAVGAILALRYRARFAVLLAWVLVAETLYDLASSMVAGVGERLFESAAGVTWVILTFYVPLLWITLALIVWQLVARRDEPLYRSRDKAAAAHLACGQ